MKKTILLLLASLSLYATSPILYIVPSAGNIKNVIERTQEEKKKILIRHYPPAQRAKGDALKEIPTKDYYNV